jgi:hypothetical protein
MHDNLGRETRSYKMASHSLPLTKQQEKQMKKNNETSFTEKLKQYGFEKKPKTEDGIQMWELDPSKLKKKEDKKNA